MYTENIRIYVHLMKMVKNRIILKNKKFHTKRGGVIDHDFLQG